MKYLFSHRNFPAQFRHLITKLGSDPNNEVVFLTETENNVQINGVKKVLYGLKRKVPRDCHRYLRQYEEAIIHGQGAAESLIKFKNSGFIPDVIYAHGWGNSLFFKDIFPDVPLINYCEWYYNTKNSDAAFDGHKPNYDEKAKLRCNNSQFLQDLISCDLGISPTEWQKSRFPKELRNKIQVVHDGIDTDYFIPNPDAEFKIPNSDTILTTKDEVLTYATRGMEPYRGFPQFMEIAKKLLQKRSSLHVVIAGQDRVCYGPKLKNGSYKELMLKKIDFSENELERLHFTGGLPYKEYKQLLQVSSVHCYLTYPFVLSWSILEAMSAGGLIVGSKTPPVEEVIKDKKNGYLIDFYNTQEFSKTIDEILEAKAGNNGVHNNENLQIKLNARKTIIDNYDLKTLLPKQIELIKNTAVQILNSK